MPLAALAGEIAGALETLPGLCASLCEGLRHRRDAVAGNVQAHSGAEALDQAAHAWRHIEDAGGAATPFQTLALARAAAAVHLARGETPHIIVAREGGRPVVVLPAVIGRLGGIRVLRFLGDPMIQYGDIPAAPEARPHHIEAAWRTLAATAAASLIYLRKVRADARIAPLLAGVATAVSADEAPFVDVQGDGQRHARNTRELGRFRRRLAEHGDARFVLCRGREARPLVQEAVRLKREWLKERGLVSQVIGDPGWEAALDRLAESGRAAASLAAACLTVGDRVAAVEVGLVQGQSWYAFIGATNADFARAGPGHLLMADTIAHCRQEGLATYDLLAPAQAYKRAMATGAVGVRDYAVALNAAGRLALWAAGKAPAAKDALAALPASVRRVLLRLTLGTAPSDGKS